MTDVDIEKRNQYWGSIYSARAEYQHKIGDNTGMTKATFSFWMQEKYGIKMGQNSDGNYTADFEVTDPNKFLLYQIKYWK